MANAEQALNKAKDALQFMLDRFAGDANVFSKRIACSKAETAIADIDLALAQPSQEPVGYAAMVDDEIVYGTSDREQVQNWIDERSSIEGINYQFAELYRHPQPAAPVAQAERHGMTDEQRANVILPERVIDALWQAAGLTDFHPDGSQIGKFYQFAHNVTAEVLARLPSTATQVEAKEGWISVKDRLPECRHECTTSGTDVSDTVLIYGLCVGGFYSPGMGHLQSNGKWVAYEGEHDFMDVRDVTHWMKIPKSPAAPTSQKEGEQPK